MSWYDAVTFDLIRHAVGVPLRNGMTATGSHEYFYSLRGAQPPGEGFSLSRSSQHRFLLLKYGKIAGEACRRPYKAPTEFVNKYVHKALKIYEIFFAKPEKLCSMNMEQSTCDRLCC